MPICSEELNTLGTCVKCTIEGGPGDGINPGNCPLSLSSVPMPQKCNQDGSCTIWCSNLATDYRNSYDPSS